jgi:hypothetical protein
LTIELSIVTRADPRIAVSSVKRWRRVICRAVADSVACVSLLSPRIAVVVVAVILPEAGRIVRSVLEADSGHSPNTVRRARLRVTSR